jgi:hypothetical protein
VAGAPGGEEGGNGTSAITGAISGREEKRMTPSFLHGLADTVSGEPRGLHAAIEHALNLAGGDALLPAAHKVDNLKPQVQRQVAVLENGSYPHGERFLAGIALAQPGPGGLAAQAADAVGSLAMRANRAIGPELRLNIGESGGFVLKLWSGQNSVGHGEIPYGRNTTSWGKYGKCNITRWRRPLK